jgi:hypothetical protein
MITMILGVVKMNQGSNELLHHHIDHPHLKEGIQLSILMQIGDQSHIDHNKGFHHNDHHNQSDKKPFHHHHFINHRHLKEVVQLSILMQIGDQYHHHIDRNRLCCLIYHQHIYRHRVHPMITINLDVIQIYRYHQIKGHHHNKGNNKSLHHYIVHPHLKDVQLSI